MIPEVEEKVAGGVMTDLEVEEWTDGQLMKAETSL